MTYSLTPTTILDLRASCPSLRNLGGGINMGVPYILYLPAEDTFCLHAYGSPQAKHADPAVLAECLRQERAEPGFIRRILSTAEPCDIASLDPAARAKHAAQRAQEAARAAAYRQEQDAAAKRRMSLLDASRLSLDDI